MGNVIQAPSHVSMKPGCRCATCLPVVVEITAMYGREGGMRNRTEPRVSTWSRTIARFSAGSSKFARAEARRSNRSSPSRGAAMSSGVMRTLSVRLQVRTARPAAEERPEPASLGRPRPAAPGDHHLDRTDLPPPTTPTRPRQAHPDRVRDDLQHDRTRGLRTTHRECQPDRQQSQPAKSRDR